MKHLLPLFLALSLFGAVLWAQSAADSTAFFQLDTLVDREDFPAAATLISATRDDSTRNGLWMYFSEKVEGRAEQYYDSEEYDKTIAVLDSALEVLKKAGRADFLATASLLSWKAATYRKLEQYAGVLEAYNEAIRIYERHHYNGRELAFCYKNAAQVYIRRQDYRQADKYLMTAINSDSTKRYLQSIYGQLANNAYWQDSLDKALRFFETGITIPGPDKSLASLRATGGNILIKTGRWREAETLQQQALDYYNADADEWENQIRCYTALADIAANTGQAANAQQFYRLAERAGENFLHGTLKSREMAKLYCEWGDFLLRENREKDALRMYQKALVQAYPKFDNLDPATNPDPGDTPLELWAMIAPARKADLLLRNPTPLARASAADCFDRAFAAAKRLRLAYETDESKLYFTRHNYDLRRNAVLNLWTWYRQTSNPTLLPRLLDLLENGRANALRDALQQQRALALTGIPDSLLHLEKELRGERAAAQTRLLEKEGVGDSVVFSRLQTALFLIERRYGDLLTFLNKNYPRFREYNQAGETANLQVIQNAMPREAVLLTFFDAGDRYLCLVLRKNTLAAYEVLRDSALNQVLARFPVLLADKQRQEAAPSDVYADAFFLKQRLLPDSVLADARSLIVVPDGLLAYLPFEALLTKPHTGSYSMAPYLLRTHSVQYAWSAALLAQEHAPGQSEKSLLQMAPFATATRTGFVALPNSLHEIPENVVADMRTDNEAGADDFLQLAAHYDVLHLSTHAYAGQRSQPGIAFHDRTVALPEIYAQRLNANLVALSACETNAGAFAEGEGVLSLARAFAYAGARSLVAGYWSVNDRSTAQLFEAFYRHLKNGLPKSEALRRAKLDLLEASGPDARKAPYHWAAFTLTGMDGPVLLEEKKWFWWIFVPAAVGLAGVGLFFLRKRGRR